MDHTKELETKSIGQLLLKYAVPAVISMVIMSVYNIADRIFIGQGVGPLAIAGLAITMPVMNVVNAFGSLVAIGSASRMSIVLGKKDVTWAENILGNSMLLTFLFGILYVGLGYLLMDNILTLFGATSGTLAYAKEYLMIVLPGMFLTSVSNNLTSLLRASGYPKKSMLIMVAGAAINMILDPLFIFVFHMGIAGAAWATTISMAISALLALIHFANKNSHIHFRTHGWRPRLYIFKNILLICCSPFLMNIAASGVVALLNGQLIRYGGDLAVGTYGIVNTVCIFLVLFTIGVCQGMQPIVGYNYGAGHQHRLKEAFTLTMKINVLFMVVGAAICMIMPNLIINTFTSDAELIRMGTPAVRLLTVMFPLVGFQVTIAQFFQSIDKPWISILLSLGRQVIFLAPLCVLIPQFFVSAGYHGLTGIWTACAVCDVLGALLSLFFLIQQKKVFQIKER